jgi:hypothetical protein
MPFFFHLRRFSCRFGVWGLLTSLHLLHTPPAISFLLSFLCLPHCPFIPLHTFRTQHTYANTIYRTYVPGAISPTNIERSSPSPHAYLFLHRRSFPSEKVTPTALKQHLYLNLDSSLCPSAHWQLKALDGKFKSHYDWAGRKVTPESNRDSEGRNPSGTYIVHTLPIVI